MRGAERIGEPGLGSNAERREPLRHVIEQIFFATEEVRDAGNVDPQSVAAIDMPVRTIAAGPARQLQKGDAVVFGLGGARNECGMRRTRIAEGRAGLNPGARCSAIDGGDREPMNAALNERERLLQRHRLRLCAFEPGDRPRGKPN